MPTPNHSKNFYITTTLPYVNAEPHIGFAAEIIRADVLARYHQELGQAVFFNTGTDEHGLKIYRQATAAGIDPLTYCQQFSEKFNDLKQALNLSYNNFVRTTDPHHQAAAQEFWRRCQAQGDIYKKNYQIKYCVGCEMEKTDSELINDRCPLHLNLELEIIEEENYFFRFSKYQKPLLEYYQNNPNFVVPGYRLTEISNFIKTGLQDFSISRLKSKMPWGVDVPGDDDQVMYVWFDALINYISVLGWPDNLENFEKFWPGIQVCGKDNLRQQTAMWPAMLLSVGLPLPKQVLVFGFITLNGQKISKSLGNTVDPIELAAKYGSDATRYYLLKEAAAFNDGDFSIERLEKAYNSDLANGLGNLVSRVTNLLEKNKIELNLHLGTDENFTKKVAEKLADYNFSEALKVIWDKIKTNDEFLTKTAPWKLADKIEVKRILEVTAQNILNLAKELKPFLPLTAEKIIKQFTEVKITKESNLFPRLEEKKLLSKKSLNKK